ncbi:embryonic protein UVS.2-like [Stegostoma tigrinum]|uniref:embryonic protein UVS.2-like n=1 Tax=Stegostoma tigrinum TaxID=3053191 RepID=UPI00286FBD4F|nr:embryonic protein UVS.2-like [Stegostoma tigrinum]
MYEYLWLLNERIRENDKKDIMYGDIAVGSSKNAKKCLLGPRTCLWPRSSDGIVYIPYTIDQSFSFQLPFILETDTRFLGFGAMMSLVQWQLNMAITYASQNPKLMERNMKNYSRAEYNFVKMDTNNLGTTYDYSSVMHYGRYAFSKDRRSVTIVPKPNPNIYIGQRYGMSNLDALKVNKLYNCEICGGLYRHEPGKFTSPNFPNLYPNNAHCRWIFKTSHDKKRVFIQFTKFQVEDFINCYSDRVIIHDGDDALAPVLEGPTCGGENPAVISSRKSLYVQFYSAQSWQAYGFSANYQFGNIVFKL